MIVLWMKIKNFILKLLHSIFCNNKTESMKLQIYKNIDVVQINIKAGVSEYYLPKNVDWADKVINKLLIYAEYPEMEEYSPVDGVSRILNMDSVKDLYFDIYAHDGKEITHSMNGENLLYTNNNPIEINSQISLQLSRIFFAIPPRFNASLLLYVSWDNIITENDNIPNENVTIKFDIKKGETRMFSDIIDSYIRAQGNKVRGIIHWGDIIKGNGTFLTLRNRNRQTIIKSLPLNLCRPPMALSDVQLNEAEYIQKGTLYLDCENIDFDNSYIQRTSENGVSDEIILTFLY